MRVKIGYGNQFMWEENLSFNIKKRQNIITLFLEDF